MFWKVKCISLKPDEEANEVVCSNLLSLKMNGSVYYGNSTGGIQMLINLFLKPPYWEVYTIDMVMSAVVNFVIINYTNKHTFLMGMTFLSLQMKQTCFYRFISS